MISVYSKKGWAGVEKVLRGLPLRERDFQRFLFAAARDVEVDRQGGGSLPGALGGGGGVNKDGAGSGGGRGGRGSCPGSSAGRWRSRRRSTSASRRDPGAGPGGEAGQGEGRGESRMATHIPGLLQEGLGLLAPRPGGIYVDATVGGGGHAEAILERIAPGGRLIGLDRDAEALAAAQQRLARFGPAVVLVHANYTRLREGLRAQGIEAVDGSVMDLGISSLQLNDPARGFSFQTPGPLDMRMDRSQPQTAADLINRFPEDEVRRILREYGAEGGAAPNAPRRAPARAPRPPP